jgi:outer membrane protein assembly factor BamA
MILVSLFLALFPSGAPCFQVQDPPAVIQSVSFEGNSARSVQQLKPLLRLSREGAQYLPGNLRLDLQQVQLFYQDSGFLNARVEAPDVQIRAAGTKGTAAIRIRIVEGPLYATGEIAAGKTQAVPTSTITQMCPLKKGEPYSRIRIAQWRSKIEDAYRSLGYLKAACTPREAVNESGKTVDCSLECTEGKPFSIGKITLTGDPSVNPAEFKKRLFFSEGGVFNPEMIALTTQYLNQSNLYEPISGSDIQMKVDDEKGTVDLSIRVAPRKR